MKLAAWNRQRWLKMNENLEKIMTMKGDWHKKEEEMWNYKSFFFFFCLIRVKLQELEISYKFMNIFIFSNLVPDIALVSQSHFLNALINLRSSNSSSFQRQAIRPASIRRGKSWFQLYLTNFRGTWNYPPLFWTRTTYLCSFFFYAHFLFVIMRTIYRLKSQILPTIMLFIYLRPLLG